MTSELGYKIKHTVFSLVWRKTTMFKVLLEIKRMESQQEHGKRNGHTSSWRQQNRRM